MSYYDYKVVSAPRQSKKAKGVREPSELFALTLTEAINEHARGGWEYVRAETLPAKSPSGFFKRASEENVTVLIFRRQREILGPRLEAVPPPVSAEHAPHSVRADRAAALPEARPQPVIAAPPPPERAKPVAHLRREPVLAGQGEPAGDALSPLRPPPRLGPVDLG